MIEPRFLVKKLSTGTKTKQKAHIIIKQIHFLLRSESKKKSNFWKKYWGMSKNVANKPLCNTKSVYFMVQHEKKIEHND